MRTNSVYSLGRMIFLVSLLISACGGATTPITESEVPIPGSATATTAPATATEPPATDMPTATVAPPTSTQVPRRDTNELVGTYRVKLPASPPGISAGYYRLTLNEDGSYIIDFSPLEAQDGIVGVTGTYTLDGSQIVFTDIEGFAACPPEQGVSGTYRWTVSSHGLILTPMEDTCQGRVYVLSTRPFPRDQ